MCCANSLLYIKNLCSPNEVRGNNRLTAVIEYTLLIGRTARNYFGQHPLSEGTACSIWDNCADVRITAFLYIIIKQNAHLFNAIFEQNNDVFYQKKGAVKLPSFTYSVFCIVWLSFRTFP